MFSNFTTPKQKSNPAPVENFYKKQARRLPILLNFYL